MGKRSSKQAKKPQQQQKPRETSRSPEEKAKELEKRMDGAFFTTSEKTPIAFMPDKVTGLRPGETRQPTMEIKHKLDTSTGISGITLPPRSIWKQGKYLSDLLPKGQEHTDEEWRTWVVPGEGTPGNFKHRLYLLPKGIAKNPEPDHPADWSEWYKKGQGNKPVSQGSSYGYSGSYGGGTWKQQPKQQASSGLPKGTVIRCTGCGHFFDMDDLKIHGQSGVCPSEQGDMVLFVMPCECHPDDPIGTATLMDGFPVKKAEQPKQDDKKEEATA
jgi:hypothetical protein